MIHGTRKTSLLGISRTQTFSMNGLIVRRDAANPELLTALDVLDAPPESADDSKLSAKEFRVESLVSDYAVTMQLQSTLPPTTDEKTAATGSYGWFTGSELNHHFPAAQLVDLRIPTQPEDCCICRSVHNDGVATSVMLSVSRDQITPSGATWPVALDTSELASWHGAPVLSMTDGKIIGVFLATKSGGVIAALR